jgi:hypothetical protein
MALACGGLDFSMPHLQDVSHAEATASGYAVPAEATHIYVHDFSSIDVRSTRFQYTLPEARVAAFMAETASDDRYTRVETSEIPSSWPTFQIFGDEARPPEWWSPAGEVVYQRSHSADLHGQGGSDMGHGAQLVYDTATSQVHLWQWEWQWWAEPHGDDAHKGTGVSVLVGPEAPWTQVELSCPSGYRRRQSLRERATMFRGLPPAMDCILVFRSPLSTEVTVQGGHRVVCSAEDGLTTCESEAR